MTETIMGNTYQEILEKAPAEDLKTIENAEELTRRFFDTSISFFEEINVDMESMEVADIHLNALVNYIGNFIANTAPTKTWDPRVDSFCNLLKELVDGIEREDN